MSWKGPLRAKAHHPSALPLERVTRGGSDEVSNLLEIPFSRLSSEGPLITSLA